LYAVDVSMYYIHIAILINGCIKRFSIGVTPGPHCDELVISHLLSGSPSQRGQEKTGKNYSRENQQEQESPS
jgi:hypothetical protein